MTDYLTRLVARSLGVGEVVRPRLGSLFEPRRPAAALPPVEESLEVDVERAAPTPAEPRREPEPAPEQEPQPQRESVEALQQSVTSTIRHALPPEVRRYEPTLEVESERETQSQTDFPATRDELTPSPAPLPAREPESQPTLQQSVTSSDREPPRPLETVVVRDRVLRQSELAQAPPEPHESWLEPRPQQTGRRPAPALDAAEPPVVRVTIGRVDVRAVVPSAAPERAAPKRRPRMTLDEYLRDGGKR